MEALFDWVENAKIHEIKYERILFLIRARSERDVSEILGQEESKFLIKLESFFLKINPFVKTSNF